MASRNGGRGGARRSIRFQRPLGSQRMVRPVRPSPDPAFWVALGMLVLWGAGVWTAWVHRAGRVFACLLLLPASFVLVLVKYESAGAFPISDRYLYLAMPLPLKTEIAGIVFSRNKSRNKIGDWV